MSPVLSHSYHCLGGKDPKAGRLVTATWNSLCGEEERKREGGKEEEVSSSVSFPSFFSVFDF